MRKYFKNIVLATLATATLTTGAATQAHAGSDLRRAILGAVAIGVIANEVKKKNEHRREVAPRYSTRSFDRRHRSDRRRKSSTVVNRKIEIITRIVATDKIAGLICSRMPFHI